MYPGYPARGICHVGVGDLPPYGGEGIGWFELDASTSSWISEINLRKKAGSDQCSSPRFELLAKTVANVGFFFQNRRYRYLICEWQLQEDVLLFYR